MKCNILCEKREKTHSIMLKLAKNTYLYRRWKFDNDVLYVQGNEN